MRKLFLFAILITVPFLTEAKVKGYYRVSLQSVDVKASQGIISNPVNDKGFTEPTYKDSVINIVFNFEPTHIDFILENQSNENIKIIWDEAIYVGGVAGVSTGVFHSGVKLIDRENSQTPTLIVKKSKISDLLVVKSGVSFSDYFGRWMYSYILFGEDKLKDVKILLPIEVAGVKYEYLFSFSVNWENIKVKTRIYDGKEYYIEKK